MKFKISYPRSSVARLASPGYILQNRKSHVQMDLHTHGVRYGVQAVGAVYMPAVLKVLPLDPHRIFLNFIFWLISISNFFFLIFC